MTMANPSPIQNTGILWIPRSVQAMPPCVPRSFLAPVKVRLSSGLGNPGAAASPVRFALPRSKPSKQFNFKGVGYVYKDAGIGDVKVVVGRHGVQGGVHLGQPRWGHAKIEWRLHRKKYCGMLG